MSADDPGIEATTEATTEVAGQDPEETEELLVEEISIDGMCGVY
jgi:mycofactocin precursor